MTRHFMRDTPLYQMEQMMMTPPYFTHGGCVSTEELEHLDGEETAILLIEGSEGTVTRYGVVYDNGMQLSQLYDGKHLPGYHYEADMINRIINDRFVLLWEQMVQVV